MKDRPDLFLSEDNIPHDGEIFNYIQELHKYLWEFIRAANPGCSGTIEMFVDEALANANLTLATIDTLKSQLKAAQEIEQSARLALRSSRETRDETFRIFSERASNMVDKLAAVTAERDRLKKRLGIMKTGIIALLLLEE